jgi:hypothetical protein
MKFPIKIEGDAGWQKIKEEELRNVGWGAQPRGEQRFRVQGAGRRK